MNTQIESITTALEAPSPADKKIVGILNALGIMDAFLAQLITTFRSPLPTFANDFAEGIKDNFQVQSLSELHNYHSEDDQDISFDFKDSDLGDIGKININDNAVDFNVDFSNPAISRFNDINNVVLLESPIYWKIKNALEFTRKEKAKIGLGKRAKNQVLTGIPQHFYDLVDLLDTRVKIDQSEANDKSIFDAINQQIGGEIEVSDAGDIYFREQGSPRSININSTASGIANIGLIALLLKRHVIAKGSYLFIDEPEVNLHPLWQKVMVETLYKLSRSGINVVIVSHSIDMMKALENIMDELEQDDIEQHFAINQLTSQGTSINDDSPVTKKLAAIKADLGKPFYDMFLENDWE